MTALMVSDAPFTRAEFPLHPPAEFFTKPAWLEEGQKLTAITTGPEAGRVAGYVAPWSTCLLDGSRECWSAPPSPTNYANAEQGETLTAEGDVVRTANIAGGTNHARVSLDFRGAVDTMQNTGVQLMRVVYGEDDYGIWCAGALWPDISDRDLAMVRASALSGDWRYRPELGAFDFAGSILVNTPGFPLVKQYATAALGGMGGVGDIDEETCCPSCGQRDERARDLHDALDELIAVGYLDHVEAALAALATR